MVSQLKGVGRDESLRMDQLGKKIEVCQVTRVWTHNDPNDYNWQSCDVIIMDAVPSDGARVSSNGPATRLRVPVLQRHIGNRSGTPWTPRVGDTVLVAFYQNDRPMIMGTLPIQYQIPVCRSSSHPGFNINTNPGGAYEDWKFPDFMNYYDWRFKLVQWLHIPRRTITDSEGRTWDTTFDHSQVTLVGKLRPVCFNYLDATRDFYVCWECLAGKLIPDCKSCTSNFYGPDWLKDVDDHTATYNAMNAWLKALSTDYVGSDDLPRRLKYRHHGGTLLCFDAAFPGNSKFQASELHRGRIWLESAELGKAEPVPSTFGHMHFRSEANLLEELYPCTPAGYGKFNLSLRSALGNGAHIEMWGLNDLLGRLDLANEEMGKVQVEDDHDKPDCHVTLVEDGTLQIHSLNDGGEIYVVASKKIVVKVGDSVVTLEPTKVSIEAAAEINLTAPVVNVNGNLVVPIGECGD